VLEQIDERRPLAWHVSVRVDDSRHDRLAGEIDPRRTGRNFDLSAPADLREPATLDDERRALNRCAAVADDEPRAFVDRRTGDCGD
jgi:hypothetical protein